MDFASSLASRPMCVSGGATGNVWTSKIYFDPNAEEKTEDIVEITDDELLGKLSGLVDVNENIKNVFLYKLPLFSKWQPTMFLFFHMFILIETENWFWTIEKNSEGITIQRSGCISEVRGKYRQTERINCIRTVLSDSSKKSVQDLIEWLYFANELNKPYHVLQSNCKHFGRACFDFMSEKTTNTGKSKHGTDMTSGIYFNADAEYTAGGIVTEEQLIEKVSALDNINERIINITLYHLPIVSRLFSVVLPSHYFILIETERWWWSFEKKLEGVTIQRSRNSSDVKNKYRQVERKHIDSVEEVNSYVPKVTKSIQDLINLLYYQFELEIPHNHFQNNSKQFAQNCFDFVVAEANDI